MPRRPCCIAVRDDTIRCASPARKNLATLLYGQDYEFRVIWGAISAIDFDGKEKSTWQIPHSIFAHRRAAKRAG